MAKFTLTMVLIGQLAIVYMNYQTNLNRTHVDTIILQACAGATSRGIEVGTR